MISTSTRSRGQEALWIVVGVALGLGCGLLVSHALQEHAGRRALKEYSSRLGAESQAMALEVNAVSHRVSHDGLAPCSDQDLAFMRNAVYNAAFIRDMGRYRGELLQCTTSLGRIVPVAEAPRPDAETRGAKFRVNIPLLLSPQSRGFVVEREGVSMVINSYAYRALDEPPMQFGAWLWVPEKRFLKHSFGHDMPLSPADITSGREFTRDAIVYRSSCPGHSVTCIVVSVPRSHFAARPTSLLLAMLLGGLLGAALAAVVLLYLQTQRTLERQLRRALRQNELRLEYQPVVELSTGRVVGAEALARWTRRNGEDVPPEVFIPLAEQRGFIADLTRAVLQLAIRDVGPALARGDLSLTINITSHDLLDAQFAPLVERTLGDAGVPTDRVGLELTERSTANEAMAVAAIKTLREKGHPVYIDDFGTGFSSLSYLHKLAVSGIKIDRSFTQTIGTGSVTASVVPQILAMAEELRLIVVVEGIETAKQAEYFAGAAPGSLGQGWYFSPSVPPARLLQMLSSGDTLWPARGIPGVAEEA